MSAVCCESSATPELAATLSCPGPRMQADRQACTGPAATVRRPLRPAALGRAPGARLTDAGPSGGDGIERRNSIGSWQLGAEAEPGSRHGADRRR